jgi:hypothetical protein
MNQPKDVTSQLAGYIKRNLAKGYNQDTLKFSLMSQGYSKITVENAIDRAHEELSVTIPPVKEKPQITYKIIDEQNRPIRTVDISTEKKKGFFSWLKGVFE